MLARIYAVIFGSDEDYLKLARQTASECENKSKDVEVTVCSPNDLPSDITEYASKYARGYGYWMWKPWLVNKKLQEIKNGDILIYFDARCGIGDRFSSVLSEFAEKNTAEDMIVWSISDCAERCWTNGDVFRVEGVELGSFCAISDQIAATFFVIRKNEVTVNFVQQWNEFYRLNRSILRDEKSKCNDHKSFIENRHDQSAFSLLLKARYILRNKIKVRVLMSDEINENNFIVPHEKYAPHEQRLLWAVRYTPDFAKGFFSRIYNRLYFLYKTLKW